MKWILVLAAFAQTSYSTPINSEQMGIEASVLADTPLSEPIDMEANSLRTNQLTLTVIVTPGTTTRVQVTCYESHSSTSNIAQLSFCDTASPSACVPDVRTFTLANYATVDSLKYIKTRWIFTERWAKCSVDDPDDGTGTVSVSATRSWQ